MKKLEGKVQQEYERRAAVIKAMAHPTRLYILDMLRVGTRCVCEINDGIDADVSTVSKHLALLKKAGLLSSIKKGLQVYYTLETPCILDALSCLDKKS